MRKIIVGTRTSKLALIQTNWVIDQLKKLGVQNEIEIREFVTKGDKNLKVSLQEVGGSGIFTGELEQSLLDEEIDFAVHSLKDIPAKMPENLVISSIPLREDARDAYIGKDQRKLEDLPSGAVIGTSSPRRASQILAKRPDLKTEWIRGPVDSRLKQLEEGKFDAIILAVAGLKRLGLDSVITEYLDPKDFVPAPGQGALAIECRKNDSDLHDILQKVNDEDTARSITAERAFIDVIEEAEEAPVGIYGYIENGKIVLRAQAVTFDGKTLLNKVTQGQEPYEVAKELAEMMIKEGIYDIIEVTKA